MNVKQRNLIIQLVIVFGLLLAVWFSFGRNVLSAPKNPDIPAQLAGMKAGNIVEGAQALSQVNKLHGTGIELIDAYIAEYSHDFNPYHNNDERVTVWVGKTRSAEEAKELSARMLAAIQKSGGSGFSDPQRLSLNGQEVIQVKGPGGQHFFYSSNNKPQIVWLTIEDSDPQRVLNEALGAF